MKAVWLERGSHATREEGVCSMELASWLAGEEHTETPECVSEPLTTVMIWINDSLDDEARQCLKFYVPRTLGTGDDGQDGERRQLITQWLDSIGLRGSSVGKWATYLRDHPEECFALIESILDPGGVYDVYVDAATLEPACA